MITITIPTDRKLDRIRITRAVSYAPKRQISFRESQQRIFFVNYATLIGSESDREIRRKIAVDLALVTKRIKKTKA